MNEKQTWHFDDYDFQVLPTFIKEAQESKQPKWEYACDLIIVHLNFPFLW